MRVKNEQEVESLGYKIQGHPVTNHAFTQGYMQAQQDLLSQVSEGFEEWWESDKDMPEILGRASERVAGITNMAQRCSILSEFWAQEAWQSANLANEKKHQERINDARKDILYLIGVLITYPVLIESKDNIGSLHQNIKEFIEKWELNK